MNQYRNFVGDPFLECCGYNAVDDPAPETKKKAIAGIAMTALMIIGVIAVAGWAYKKIK